MLRAFVELLPEGTRAAFEFRHASWLDDEVFDVLRAEEHRAVRRGQREAEHAGRNHRRLRLLPAARRGLSTGRHRAMGGRRFARSRASRDVFVYFKHEEQGLGPDFARRFIELCAESSYSGLAAQGRAGSGTSNQQPSRPELRILVLTLRQHAHCCSAKSTICCSAQ